MVAEFVGRGQDQRQWGFLLYGLETQRGDCRSSNQVSKALLYICLRYDGGERRAANARTDVSEQDDSEQEFGECLTFDELRQRKIRRL